MKENEIELSSFDLIRILLTGLETKTVHLDYNDENNDLTIKIHFLNEDEKQEKIDKTLEEIGKNVEKYWSDKNDNNKN